MTTNARTRVAHLTSVHSAFDLRIFGKECRTLADAGYDVCLIAPHDADQIVDGVRIRRIPCANSRSERMLRTTWRVLGAALKEKADVYHFHDPELIPVGLLLKARGKRVIYDVHEDVPSQTLGRYWIPRYLRGILARVISVVERVTARAWDGIVGATPTISARFPAAKTITIHNYPVAELPLPADLVPLAERERCIAYAGVISHDRGLFPMMDALAKIDGRLLLAGKFSPPSLIEKVRALPAWSRVDFRGQLDRRGVEQLLGESRVGIVTLLPTPSYLPSLPVKLFEYMLAGLPVVASDFPIWREIVDGAHCGILVNPNDAGSIAEACQWLLDHPQEGQEMGARGRKAVMEKYNWSSESRRLVDFYQRFARPDQTARRRHKSNRSRAA